MTSRQIAVCALVALFSATANAQFMQNYGTFNGTTVMYIDVTESNQGNGPLFGAPTIVGNLLDFNPVGFVASSNGPAVIRDSQLNMLIMANNPGQPITNVIISEAGDFTLAGLGNALAQATVGANVIINVTEVNGVPQFVPCGNFTMTFAPVGAGGNGIYQLPGNAGTAVPWMGNLNINIAACAPGATKVDVVLDNTLTAAAANGGSAFIAKKDFRGVTITVPEPNAVACLLAIGLAITGWRRLANHR